MRQLQWRRIVAAGFFAEATVFAIFFLLLFAATAAGVPELARPMSTLDSIDAIVASFATVFLFTLWAGRRIDSAFVLHGVLIGVFGILLFGVIWLAATRSLAQPPLYVVAHVMKVLGGIAGGLVAEKRKRHTLPAKAALHLEHAVEADVSPAFAWNFRTDIATWNDPPATIALDRPFAAGAQGTTAMPGEKPVQWCVRDVQPRKSFLIEMQLDRATLWFLWRFDALSERRTRITQQIELSGSNASAYMEQVQADFGSNLAEGMQRIAAEMAAAEKASTAPRASS